MHKDTPRRLRYATGYIELNLLNDASDELEAIAFEDRLAPPVLAVRIELHLAAEQWETVVGVGRELAHRAPENERGWICWAYALRALQRVEAARDVLLEAEPLHGKASATLHYSLGCYYCLLGQLDTAIECLKRAFELHPEFKHAAVDDPDLAGMFG
jgi:tetratricopeptide (TPR) repeat protein